MEVREVKGRSPRLWLSLQPPEERGGGRRERREREKYYYRRKDAGTHLQQLPKFLPLASLPYKKEVLLR